MKNMHMIRKLIQIILLFLFLIQLHQSLGKYFEYPVVTQTTIVPVEQLPAPVVYICQNDQFNYTSANTNGYQFQTQFFAGIRMGRNTLSWNGKNGNIIYQDLEKMLFDFDYTSINSSHPMQETFLFPNGFCMKLKNISSKPKIRIDTKKKIWLLLIDPARANNLNTEETLDAQTTLGPISETHFEYGTYEIEYKVLDHSIHEGILCTDYGKAGMSYGKCIEDLLEEALLSTYGCTPPWLKVNKLDQVCTQVTKTNADAIRNSTIFKELYELLGNRKVEMFKKCLPPCVTMEMKLRNKVYRTNLVHAAIIDVKSLDYAAVEREVLSYDIFSLTVDLGSGLGLWLGLSCLNVLDFILERIIYVLNYVKEK